MEIRDEIRDWVRQARKAAGLSGADLGAKLALELRTTRGHSKGNISHWELGKHQPSVQQLLAISKITGVPLPAGLAVEPGPQLRNEHSSDAKIIRETDVARQPEDMQMQWVCREEVRLLTLFRCTDQEGQESIVRFAETMPRVSLASVTRHQS